MGQRAFLYSLKWLRYLKLKGIVGSVPTMISADRDKLLFTVWSFLSLFWWNSFIW